MSKKDHLASFNKKMTSKLNDRVIQGGKKNMLSPVIKRLPTIDPMKASSTIMKSSVTMPNPKKTSKLNIKLQ
jgi:hypothetical protein